MALIIGFGNRARHGKDTAAEAVAKYHYAKIYKFATALYAEVNEFLKGRWMMQEVHNTWIPINGPIHYPRKEIISTKPFSEGTVLFNADWYPIGTKMIQIPEWVTLDPNPEISALAPYGKHPKLLQWWGSEYRRAQNVNYWTEKLVKQIREDNVDIALVTDVRFPNEAEVIKNEGGYTVNVARLNQDGTPFRDPSRPSDHVSETALDGYNWDFRLTNSHGHQALLEQQANTLVEYLKGLK